MLFLGDRWRLSGVVLTNFVVGVRTHHLTDGLIQKHSTHDGGDSAEGSEPEDEGYGNLALPLHVEAGDDGDGEAQHEDVERETACHLPEADSCAVEPEVGLHEGEGDRVEFEKHEQEEQDGPGANDADHTPHDGPEHGRWEDALVEEQHRDLDRAEGELHIAGGYKDELITV